MASWSALDNQGTLLTGKPLHCAILEDYQGLNGKNEIDRLWIPFANLAPHRSLAEEMSTKFKTGEWYGFNDHLFSLSGRID